MALNLGLDKLQPLIEKLRNVQKDLRKARKRKAAAEQSQAATAALPSKEAIRQSLREYLGRLAATSFEFADLLRRILPGFAIQPGRSHQPQPIREP